MSLLASFTYFAILKLRKKRARTSKRLFQHPFLCSKHSCHIIEISFLKRLGWITKSALVFIFLFKRQLRLLETLFLGDISSLLSCHSGEETQVQSGKKCAWSHTVRARSHTSHPQILNSTGAGAPVPVESSLSQRTKMMMPGPEKNRKQDRDSKSWERKLENTLKCKLLSASSILSIKLQKCPGILKLPSPALYKISLPA